MRRSINIVHGLGLMFSARLIQHIPVAMFLEVKKKLRNISGHYHSRNSVFKPLIPVWSDFSCKVKV
jgi:hypothetical protein